MKYADAIAYLFSIHSRGIKLSLEEMKLALKKLSIPFFKTIHIAGTNGKGSVSTKIAKSLELAGYKVGLYTSPHISSFRERIQINGSYIPEKAVVEHLKTIQNHSINATFFETATLMAFLYFAKEQVDYAVIETGLGGRKDATNCITPELSIITSIAIDHQEILGNTIEAIAYEKAGIIKKNIPALIGPRVPFQMIRQTTETDLYQVKGIFSTFDEENSAIAKQALHLLNIKHTGGCSIRPPCRLEQVDESRPIILDVAHNPDGLKALFKSLRFLYPKKTFSAIIGLSDSKDIEGCLHILTKHTTQLHLIQAKHRGAPLNLLSSYLGKFPHQIHLSLKDALNHSSGPLLICGTFFIMDEARKALNLPYPSDPVQLNEITR